MLLVKFGANIHQLDSDGDTALDLAETAELKQAMLREHDNFHCVPLDFTINFSLSSSGPHSQQTQDSL